MRRFKWGKVPSFEQEIFRRNWAHENRLFSFHALTYRVDIDVKMSIVIKSRRKTHKLQFFGIERQSLHNPTKSGSNLAGIRNMERCKR